MSSKVSRLTLKGMFFMTIAVGMTSSSPNGVPGVMGGACMWLKGGDPPEEDRSELLGGDRERLSGIPPALSSHCWIQRWRVSYMAIDAEKPPSYAR